MPNSIITHLQNQPILADEQEKIVNDPAFKKCLSDYEIRLLYLPDLKDSLGNYLTINNKKYIKTKDLQLITHNNNWRQTSQNIDKYQFK